MPIPTSLDISRSPLHALFHHASSHADADALVLDGDTWSYGRLATEIVRLGNGLRHAGIEPGDRIVTAIGPSPVHAVFLFAAMMTGAILVPLSKEYNAIEFRDFVDLLKPALLVHDADMEGLVSQLDPGRPDRSRVFVCADDHPRSWRHLLEDPSETDVELPTDIDSTFLLLATSGTTGRPKLVAYNQRNFHYIVEASGRWAVDGNSCFILMSPPAIISGNINIIMAAMAGCKVVLIRGFDPGRMLDLIERHRGTTLFLAPFRCMPLVEAQKKKPRDVSSLRICGLGGDACRPGIAQAFESTFGVRLSNSYGMTECLGSMIFGSDWRTLDAVPGRARLADSAGNEVPNGTIGELQMRGPNVSLGYWVGPDDIVSHSKDGWFHSGDLMKQDDKGEYTYIGRANDAINVRNAKQVYPIEVENQLILHESVDDAAVVGVSDGESRQIVAAVVTLAEHAGSATTTHDLLEWLATRLEPYKIPEGIVVADTIPRNSLGKIERQRVARIILSS